ncbi:MAG: Nif11-like leader peptide family natural product precursor [Dolichospermum sp.]|jgi:hypothetical protein|uniref:Nif11 domain-containing protein n=1 Tax=Microcystis aeruginosa NIES-2519 TaxID=2303981 RepID=A0A5A5RCW7_MICAE|nr:MULTISPECIES: Nif11-like leader peptide family natural product precursor [Microcystis]AVQ71170.1 hypothetical protein B5D77_07470 [Microcystis sp. MC19]MCA2666594.1 Nif11-like leader peptide family natural product precursor [Microcystis sp. M045S2]MCA2713166.1 Nif11-like leader peptide family natural product precursor [Microcystis sp. M172S2]MCA2803730.1 Nif11-like leader peptide family natural product precursor [Microcystis sp. M114S2]MCA2834797.1 Nif11-like leader peptide family natural p
MSKREVCNFLKALAEDSLLKNELKVKEKDEVMRYAQQRYDFTQREFDDFVWVLENLLADKRGEKFDLAFSLWETMWGKYYLEFVVDNVIGSLSDQDLEKVIGS